MRRLFIACVALAAIAAWGFSTSTDTTAAEAAAFAKIPHSSIHGGATAATPVAWLIYRKWYNGCNRERWCHNRYWRCYSYGCKWVYSNCYWGGCYYGGGGYRGGGY